MIEYIEYTSVAAVIDHDPWQAIGLLMLWATFLLGSAWMLNGILRRASSAVRYCVWQFAWTALLLLPAAFSVLPGIPLGLARDTESTPSVSHIRPTTTATPGARAPGLEKPVVARSFTPHGPTDRAHSSHAMLPSAAPEEREHAGTLIESPTGKTIDLPERRIASRTAVPLYSWSEGLIDVWAFGVVVQLSWLVWCIRRAGRLMRAATPVDDLAILRIQEACQRQFSLSRPVRLLKSASVCTPLAIGVCRPSILLPANCIDWPAKTIRMVLSHELAHVKRRDVFWQLAARTAAALYWFHPLTWLALRRMRQERERACDDRVLLAGVPALDYAAGLAEFAAALAGRPLRLVGSLGMAEQLPLEDRVRSILDASVARNPASTGARGMLLAVATCLVLLLSVLRPFSPVPTAAADAPKSGGTGSSTDVPKTASKSESKSAAAPAAKPAPQTGDGTISREPKQLPTKGSMLVRVLGPDGQPIAGAKLHANVSSWDRDTEWDKHWAITNNEYVSGPDGAVEIKLPKLVEDLRLWVRKDGYAPMFAIWWPKNDPALAAMPEEFTYHMQTGTILGGIVRNDEGRPIEGVKVEAQYEGKGIQTGVSSRAVFDTWLSEGESAVTTDPEGRWKLDNVPPGDDVDVRVKLSHPDYIDDRNWGQLQKEQHIATKALRAQTAVIVMHRGTVVTGTVTDRDGKPVKDAVVIWGDRPYWEVGSQEVRTDEQGMYRFPPLPPGPMRVTVVAEKWRPDSKKIEIAPQTPATDFSLQPGMPLRIRFVDRSGAPVAGVGVSIKQWRGAEALYNHKHSHVVDVKIPLQANNDGIFEWSWAPDDAVTYGFHKSGFAETTASITASENEYVQTMSPILRITGSVRDAVTGKSIDVFTAVPVIYFRPDFPFLERQHAIHEKGGQLSMDFERIDIEHGVQVEAAGYATFRTSGRYRIGDSVSDLAIRLEPVARYTGRVVNDAGRAVGDARVYVATGFQHLDLNDLEDRGGEFTSNYQVKTTEDGQFEIVPQMERYAVVVVAPEGFAEVSFGASEKPGEIRIDPWARVSGTLVQSGKPIPDCRVMIDPIRYVGGDEPRINARFQGVTGDDGSFAFDRVPPGHCRVRGFLHFSRQSPLRSSRSVPLHLKPQESARVTLGGNGIDVTGQLAVENEPAGFDYHFSISYLVAKRAGIKPPESLAAKGFDWRKGWSDSWMNTQEGGAYLETLDNWFVKPATDGRFLISGVEPGDYEFAVNLYGSTEGCLVHPAATRVIGITVKPGQSKLDLGKLAIPALPLPQVGDMASDFHFAGVDGKKGRLSALRGKYVLLDFWATWCAPCVAKLDEVERVRKQHSADDRLAVLGVNLDADTLRAEEFLKNKSLPWHHALLGDWSNTEVPRKYGISSIPAYVLIDPDGRIMAQEYSVEKIVAKLKGLDENQPDGPKRGK